MSYVPFLQTNWRFVGFGFVLTLASSFGQTFYIALSSAGIRAEFDLSHGAFGEWFAVATVASAATLVWLGRMIDRVDLRLYAAGACGGLLAAMLLIANAPTVAVLALGLYLARLCGQGLLIHTASTSMGRYFEADRGKAISVALVGLATGEALLPALAVALIAQLGWRDTWLVVAGAATVALAVLVPWLLRGQVARHQTYLARIAGYDATTSSGAAQWTRGDVLRDPRFYVVASAVLAFSFIATGLFFHQVHIAAVKGWPLALYAHAFLLFAVLKVATSLAVGGLIDRWGSVRLLPTMLVALAAALVVIASFDAAVVPFVYLALLGISVGVLMPVMGAVWPELYGVAHLGAIRAMMAALTALTSALSPAIFGVSLDAGLSIETIALVCLAYVVGCTAVVVWTFRDHRPGIARSPRP